MTTSSSRSSRRGTLELVLLGLVVVTIAVAVAAVRFSSSDGTCGGGHTGADLHSLVADPTAADRLFVGGPDAVSISNDAGRTWSEIESLTNTDAMGWAFTGGQIWVAGHPGLHQSIDAARTFLPHNEGLPSADVHALGGDDRLILAAGPQVGVLISTDGAANWSRLAEAGDVSLTGRIIVDAATSEHLLAADAASGPVESDDGGRSWRTLTQLPATWISADPTLSTIVASGPNGAIVTTDGGANWEPLTLPDGASLVEVDPHRQGRLYAGIHAGAHVDIQVSDDGGRTWRDA